MAATGVNTKCPLLALNKMAAAGAETRWPPLQLGKLLSCVIGLRLSVAGITVIAIGTSLPDTFASRTAALHDTHADAAIGNITGDDTLDTTHRRRRTAVTELVDTVTLWIPCDTSIVFDTRQWRCKSSLYKLKLPIIFGNK